jgi:peptidoglycan/xylan/chitin deacetylase (PgdA/CDA1 family)
VSKLFYSKATRILASATTEALWRMPGRFHIVGLAFPSYSLRCVVFHNVSPLRSPFTSGINVNVTPGELETALKYLTTFYTPVRLEDVLSNGDGHGLPQRPVLVTFDDAYASVAEYAAPLCRRYGVPALFFVNAAFVDNQRLAPDNLICYTASEFGLKMINAAVRTVPRFSDRQIHSLTEVFDALLSSMSLSERKGFLEALLELSGVDERKMAMDAQLYLTRKHLCGLRAFDFEIGNHTYSHTYCRTLSPKEFVSEVGQNKMELEAMTGGKIRSFSAPYGSSRDVSQELKEYLEASGHEAVFLSESVANLRRLNLFHIDRVNPSATNNETLFCEMEALPRLRLVRNMLRLKSRPDQVGSIDSNVESERWGASDSSSSASLKVSERRQTRA